MAGTKEQLTNSNKNLNNLNKNKNPSSLNIKYYKRAELFLM